MLRKALVVFAATFMLIALTAAFACGVTYEGTFNEAAINYGLEVVFSGLGGLLWLIAGLAALAGLFLLTRYMSKRGKHNQAGVVTLVGVLLGAIGLAKVFTSSNFKAGPFMEAMFAAALFTLLVMFIYDEDWRRIRAQRKRERERRRRERQQAVAEAPPDPTH